ncbi:unnamed protein product [Amoebophrya sp. A120]|nr:unnamed protein product [Amoebophrya sp. A120]|eukprot:GSA120T00019143001.1
MGYLRQLLEQQGSGTSLFGATEGEHVQVHQRASTRQDATSRSTSSSAVYFPPDSTAATQRLQRRKITTTFLAGDPAHCTRDYDHHCPEGWFDTDGRGNCWPPHSYQGPCQNLFVGSNSSVSEKETHSHRCRVKWPCVPGSVPKNDAKGLPKVQRAEDFGHICPDGWVLMKKGSAERPSYVCKAPETYAGPCFPVQNLKDLTPSERKVWGRLCHERWPEVPKPQVCPGGEDWDYPCPRGWDWIQKDNTCIAPPGWRSPVEDPNLCSSAVPAFTNKDLKRIFVETCQLDGWSCLQPGACPGGSYHFSESCPRGWLEFKGFCLPPKNPTLLRETNEECRHPWFISDLGNIASLTKMFGKERVGRIQIPATVVDKGKYLFSQVCGAVWSCDNPEDNKTAEEGINKPVMAEL